MDALATRCRRPSVAARLGHSPKALLRVYVVDTNVFVSAVITGGTSRRLLDLGGAGRIRVIAAPPVIAAGSTRRTSTRLPSRHVR